MYDDVVHLWSRAFATVETRGEQDAKCVPQLSLGLLMGTRRSEGASATDVDGDGNENGKKAIGLISKTTALHVHHAFFVHFFARRCTTTT